MSKLNLAQNFNTSSIHDKSELLEIEINYLQIINRVLMCKVSDGFKHYIEQTLNLLAHDLNAEIGHWYWNTNSSSNECIFESQEEWVCRNIDLKTFEIFKSQTDNITLTDTLPFFNKIQTSNSRVLTNFLNESFSRLEIPSLTLFKTAIFVPFKINGILCGFIEFFFLNTPKLDSYLYQFVDNLSETISQQMDVVKQLEEEKQQVFQLAQSTRLSSLGAMAGGIAHEINNPLTIIMGSLKLAINELSSPILEPEQKEKIIIALDKAKSHTHRISKIIKGIRAMSRDGANDQFTQTTVKDIIEDAYNLCESKIKTNNIQLTIEMENENQTFDCRQVQISQILLNLINNSMDAIGDLSDPWIHIQTKLCENDQIEFTVTDCGKGIPDQIANQLMQPFFTTKGAGRGTGLGLSISKEIVKAHSGTFFLNRNFEYTQFIIRFPLVQKFNNNFS